MLEIALVIIPKVSVILLYAAIAIGICVREIDLHEKSSGIIAIILAAAGHHFGDVLAMSTGFYWMNYVVNPVMITVTLVVALKIWTK